jgi:branched-chain amino acid transport system substrate-binding protein
MPYNVGPVVKQFRDAGITGAITFSADAHVPQKGVTIIGVKGGKFTLTGEVVPEKVPAP